ncbi:hypothetical protein, partial [Enterococcus faecium]|uniref:hypothetical protein n=1 Tax=Enterococcus faecium TaxID=1352 RepID=UPI0034E9884E
DINNSGFGVVVSITSNTPTVSHYLKATNFGFSIPGGATINGILAEFNIFANTLSTSLSFAKGTKIQTINGLKNIEDITKNDIVYAFDENKNVKPVKVNGTMSRIANDIVTIN